MNVFKTNVHFRHIYDIKPLYNTIEKDLRTARDNTHKGRDRSPSWPRQYTAVYGETALPGLLPR